MWWLCGSEDARKGCEYAELGQSAQASAGRSRCSYRSSTPERRRTALGTLTTLDVRCFASGIPTSKRGAGASISSSSRGNPWGSAQSDTSRTSRSMLRTRNGRALGESPEVLFSGKSRARVRSPRRAGGLLEDPMLVVERPHLWQDAVPAPTGASGGHQVVQSVTGAGLQSEGT